MNDHTSAAVARVRERVSAEEWAAREDLAACYRLAAHFRMTDLIYTHISARVPGPEHHFLINAFGQMWDEITASSLVKVTAGGEIVDDPLGLGIHRPRYLIHSAVRGARARVLRRSVWRRSRAAAESWGAAMVTLPANVRGRRS